MARILSGKEFAAKIKEDAGRAVAELKAAGIHPRLAVVIVGADPASEVYVRNKQKACAELGIISDHIALPAASLPHKAYLAAILWRKIYVFSYKIGHYSTVISAFAEASELMPYSSTAITL